jgi:hypothetical protein
MRVWVDGASTIDVVDPHPLLFGGIGVHNLWESEGRYDDVVVNSLPTPCLGDLNCDGVINFDDINPFVLAMTDPVAYIAAYPDCDRMLGDIDGDGYVTFHDINPFVALLTGGQSI